MFKGVFGAYVNHTTKIENLIDALVEADNPDDPYEQARICEEVGIKLDWLSDSEIEYIEEEVAKRR